MTQQIIGTGSAPNDGTGDPARTAFTKVNANFTDLYAGNANFVQSGTGAVTRTTTAKLQESVSVKDFGAVGDGVTDDTAAAQAAATAAAGSKLIFPGGATYLISGITVASGTTVDMTGATIKQKVLASLNGSPVFSVTGANCVFTGGTINGQAASQPADGFSDSFNGGSNGTGRAYRAAIVANAVTYPSITNLVVRGVSFTAMYGACVATLDVPTVRVTECRALSTYFELAYLYRSAATCVSALVNNNVLDTLGSGDATVNSDGIVVSQYERAVVSGNVHYSTERCFTKIEKCNVVAVTGNVADTNTKNFPAIQVTAGSGKVSITGNTTYNTNKGVYLSASSSLSTISATISGNTIDTTAGTSPDGIICDATTIGRITISNNTLTNIYRHGIYITGIASEVVISNNVGYGQAQGTSTGILLNANGGNWNHVQVIGNSMSNFEAGSNVGVLALTRSAAETFGNVVILGNNIDAGGNANRCLRWTADYITAGLIADNFVIGQLEGYSDINFRNNIVSGTVIQPAHTFTPAITFGGGNTGVTYTTQNGFYRLIGNRVFFTVQVTLSNKGSSTGAAVITGLPFANRATAISVCNINTSNVTFTGSVGAEILAAASSISLVTYVTAGALALLTDAGVANNSDFRISGDYAITDNAQC